MEAAYVYVRSPAAAGVLAPAYKGPFRVVKTTEKYFILDLGGRRRRREGGLEKTNKQSSYSITSP
jgi:hypothetical protein